MTEFIQLLEFVTSGFWVFCGCMYVFAVMVSAIGELAMFRPFYITINKNNKQKEQDDDK